VRLWTVSLLLAATTAAPAMAEEPAATSTASSDDESDDGHRLKWTFPRFSTVEYGLTAALYLELALIEYRTEQPDPRWSGPILFDEPVRRAFALRSRGGRDLANALSNPTTLVLQALPATIDALVVPLFFDDWNFDVAWQMTMLNALGLGTQGFLQRLAIRTSARERPDAEACRDDPEYSGHCGRGATSTFYSGHTGGAFAGAGLMCAHHLHLPLFGGGVADALGCAIPLTSATATGVLRLMGDRHYVSDVLVGAGVGFAAGFALPIALHYGRGGHDGAITRHATITPLAGADLGGMALTTVF
jgi:PAP2 superfamily